jgi:hypothetical protein
MTQEEMTKEFYALYNMMANSQNPSYMHVFGMATQEMFKWFVANKPELAQEWLEKLESIRWHQYLSQKEAEKIVDGMVPKAPWKRDVWKQAMTQLDLPMEEEPYYNSCALWTEMNKQYSDHAQTIADNILKKPLAEIPAEQIVPGIRAMALDLLKDKDHVYNIREYFHL